jgi:integrase
MVSCSRSQAWDGAIGRGERPLARAGGVWSTFVVYDLRHTFATRFAEATAGDVVALAAILGHANLCTVMRYVHLSREHRRTQMQRFVRV